jgi:hypothetical protein
VRLVAGSDLWFRTLVELGRTHGWRVSELLTMKVAQVDLIQRVIRPAPGTTKNRKGPDVFMTGCSLAVSASALAWVSSFAVTVPVRWSRMSLARSAEASGPITPA